MHVQAAARGWRARVDPRVRIEAPKDVVFLETSHLRDKHRRAVRHRIDSLLHGLGIKLLLRPDGTEEWHGCTRDTPRCFGTIVVCIFVRGLIFEPDPTPNHFPLLPPSPLPNLQNDRPEYLSQGRWTPPCCMRHIRITGRFVFATLDKAGAKWWLEGGRWVAMWTALRVNRLCTHTCIDAFSLLGAVRHADIIPWDYDIDVGIMRCGLGGVEEPETAPGCTPIYRSYHTAFPGTTEQREH